MRILLVHGVNTNEDALPNPYAAWVAAITSGMKSANFSGAINATCVNYNDIFDNHGSNILVYGIAAAELVASALAHAVTTPAISSQLAAPAPQPGPGFLDAIRWSAGMVAQWVVEDGLRSDCRDRLVQQIQASQPDVIFAHSLGTLVCYDLFTNDPRGKTVFTGGTLITFGTQIGNVFVKDRMWGGDVGTINVAKWYNLYNSDDPVFVAPVDVAAPNFHQFTTTFGSGFFDMSAHDATEDGTHPGYLDNSTTDANLWPLLAGGAMASLLTRNIQIVKRMPANPAPSALASLTLPRVRRKVKHTYRYHPPRADHPLLKLAPRAVGMVGATLPPSADLRNFCLAIRDQGEEGACSGFATAAFREASHAVAIGNLLAQYLSPAYLYGRTRIEDGTFPADSGASIADEFSVLQNFGVCPESFLPYDADPTEAPTPNADTAAMPFRLSQPLQVDFTNSSNVKSVLAINQTITIGFMAYESFENPNTDGIVSVPNPTSEKLLGGHGVLVCGYDDTKSYWVIRNQWGTDWGAGGYCFMPYGYEKVWTEAWTGAAIL